ncbi:MAG: L-seryl-tRNA(Sec) selenium transferase [Candidatus Marinimicrobia bacterium]|nr:L-seryl-tRNA(Sec) selenium transferase [Candidatus Neomarinimicrobiota bacterium]
MQTNKNSDPRSQLPSVSDLLDQPSIKRKVDEYSRQEILKIIKSTLDTLREKIEMGMEYTGFENVVTAIHEELAKYHKQDLRPVINATGIVLHTGLGRAVLPDKAAKAISELNHYCNLQIDLESGKRGKRHYRTEALLCQLTGAEAAHIVNNNAAATLLILTALCKDKEVIISRGQLIEIGGSYRLPDCLHQSGAKMVEVGTTNKTHIYDYENAISENTGAILHVNPSNYHIQGFSEQVPIEKLVDLKQQQALLVIDDLGCGAIEDMQQWDLPYEPTVRESIQAGADLVCFSGDKLIGGPQAGIIVGKKEFVDEIKKHPLARMLRAGKITEMALEKTLRLFSDKEKLIELNPTYKMLVMPERKIKNRVHKIKERLSKMDLQLKIESVQCKSAVGGGSMPEATLASWGLAISSNEISAERISYLLRAYETPVIAYIEDEKVVLDFRTILGTNEEDKIIQAVESVDGKI